MEFETAEVVGRIWLWVMISLMFFEARPVAVKQKHSEADLNFDSKPRQLSVSEKAQRPLKICRRVDNF